MSSSSPSSIIPIQLSPKPGFCTKTSTLSGAVLPSHPSVIAKEKSATSPTPVPEGLKVFVNIAWDPNVPPSPPGSEEAILRAIQGEYVAEDDANGLYIPAIVSNVREDKDKAGNPSLVFDCVYNTTLKARLIHDPEVKAFLIELSLQRIESQTGLILSREIKTPNISSKGKLLPRTAQVPASLLLETPLGATSFTTTTNLPKLDSNTSTSKENESLATNSDPHTTTTALFDDSADDTNEAMITLPPLDWSWMMDDGGGIKIEVTVPGITIQLIKRSTVDMELRRFILHIPSYGLLDVNLDLSDADISSHVTSLSAMKFTSKSDSAIETWEDEETMRRLQLKRKRELDVENATAEWMIGRGIMSIYC